jgi:hypothetical protein
MRLNKLRRKILRQVTRELAAERMTKAQADSAWAVCEDKEKLAELNERIEAEVNPWRSRRSIIGMKGGDVLANLIDWFKENWATILRLILTLIPIFLEPKHDEDS